MTTQVKVTCFPHNRRSKKHAGHKPEARAPPRRYGTFSTPTLSNMGVHPSLFTNTPPRLRSASFTSRLGAPGRAAPLVVPPTRAAGTGPGRGAGGAGGANGESPRLTSSPLA